MWFIWHMKKEKIMNKRFILRIIECCKDCPNFGYVDRDYELPGDRYGRGSCDEMMGGFRLPKGFDENSHYIHPKCPLPTKIKILKTINNE